MINSKILQAIDLINEILLPLNSTGKISKIDAGSLILLNKTLQLYLNNETTPKCSRDIVIEYSLFLSTPIPDSVEGDKLKVILKSIGSEIFKSNYDLIKNGRVVSIDYDSNNVPIKIKLLGIKCERDMISFNSLMPLIKERIIGLIKKSLEAKSFNKDKKLRDLCEYVYQILNIHPHTYTNDIETLANEIMNSREFKQFKIDLWNKIKTFNFDNISRNSMIPVKCNFIENDSIELFVASLKSTKV
jgi:hypothetical protein